MTSFFKTSNGTSAPITPDTQLRIQSSVMGLPRAIGYGRCRVAGNLIWYGDFTATAVQQSPSGGKGGGGSSGGGKGGSISGYSYTAAVAIALAEGPINEVIQLWIGSTQNTLASQNLTTLVGDYAQVPWSYLTSLHPTQALNYRGLAYVAAGPLQLGGTPALPNLNFDVFFGINGLPNLPDADPAAAITDFLTNPYYGLGFPPERLDALATYSAYCRATGMMISDCLTQQEAAASWISDLLEATNSEAVWSSGKLTIVPYGDATITAGTPVTLSQTNAIPTADAVNTGFSYIGVAAAGPFLSDGGVTYVATGDPLTNSGSSPPVVGQYQISDGSYIFAAAEATTEVTITFTYSTPTTYVPPSAPIYDLDDDDYILYSGNTNRDSAITVTRTRQSDALNDVKVEYLDRSNSYNPAIVEAMDDAAITSYGLRASDTKQAHFFCLATAAQQSAQLQLGRQMVRNTFVFTVGPKYILLDPMDIITITDANLGLNRQWVRIKEIQENTDYTLTITAEEYLAGTGAHALYSPSIPSGFAPNFNAQPGSVNAPVIFEPTFDLAGAMEVWAAVSGATPANWGGCDVYLSSDGTTYKYIGTQAGPARMGVLTQTLPTLAGTEPTQDNTNILAVDLTESASQLSSGSEADELGYATLCYVDGELLSYRTATLTGAYKYNLADMLRGAYNTTGIMNTRTHAIGSAFVRLDDGVFKYAYDQTAIGSTIYLKFLSFNLYGFQKQTLSDATAYPYTIQGLTDGFTTVQDFAATGATQLGTGGLEIPAINVTWTPITNSSITSVVVEYYPDAADPSTSVQVTFSDPSTGSGFIVSGIQAATLYDVRATITVTPATLPTSWTGYVQCTTPNTLVISPQIDTPPAVPTGLALADTVTVNADGTILAGIAASWTAVTSINIAGYDVRLSVDGGTTWLTNGTTAINFAWTALHIGATATVEVRSVSIMGSPSAWSTAATLLITGTPSAPGSITSLTATPGIQNVFLQWANPSNPDLSYVEIWQSPDVTFADAVLIAQVSGSAAVISHLTSGVTYYFYVRPVNTSGLKGSYTPATSGAGTSCTTGKIGTTDIAANNITANLLAANCIVVGTAAVQNGAIVNAMIGTAAVQTLQVDGNNITTAGSAAGSVSGMAPGTTATAVGSLGFDFGVAPQFVQLIAFVEAANVGGETNCGVQFTRNLFPVGGSGQVQNIPGDETTGFTPIFEDTDPISGPCIYTMLVFNNAGSGGTWSASSAGFTAIALLR